MRGPGNPDTRNPAALSILQSRNRLIEHEGSVAGADVEPPRKNSSLSIGVANGKGTAVADVQRNIGPDMGVRRIECRVASGRRHLYGEGTGIDHIRFSRVIV